jgi:hypothetical protein
MKVLNKIWGIALLAFTLILSAPHTSIAQQEGEYISDQEFYDELQPYGTWIYDPQYGNVWIPDVEEDFRPYATRGYWAMTSYGNTWVSDYPWGWATFHYGRWHFDNYYGWEWVPGNEWAPAWVSWRDGGGYYGWAPMEPGISMDASYSDNYSVPDNYWVFAPYAYINYTNVYNYYVPYNRTRTIIRNTNWLRNRYNYNNRVYNAGPRREEIQRYSHRPVRVYNINNVNRPSRITVNNNNINIYRPSVRQNTNARPARVVDGNAYKQQNPTQRIGSRDRSRGTVYNAANAAKLAQAAKANTPDSRVVRVNSNDDRANVKPARPGAVTPGNANQPARTNRPTITGDAQQQQRAIDKQQGTVRQQQMRERREKAQSEATQQQTEQQKQQLEQQRVQQQQARQQQLEQQKQQREQNPQQPTRPQRASRPAVTDDGQAQQRQKVLEQQKQQQEQVRQQQVEQKQQQAQQVRQQQEQQRSQQAEQQKQQVRQQQVEQQQQAREQQRQQQAEQQKQQVRQQQVEQQQQAREQQRQQQAEQQKQQARQQQEQQQQAREQQRQQQAEQQQQRQQQEQQRQQKQAEPSHRPTRP